MNEVFEKTRELGEAIQRSDEYLTLKAAEHMNMVDDIIHLNQAQKAFSTLIDEVNSVLRFIVTGEMPSEDKGGCSGSCATCHGCGSKVN